MDEQENQGGVAVPTTDAPVMPEAPAAEGVPTEVPAEEATAEAVAA